MTDWPDPERDDVEPLIDAVSAVLRALSGSPTAQELAGEEPVVAAMSVIVTRPSLGKERSMRTKVITTRAVALAAAGVVLFGGAAAAAAGSLPSPIQSFVHAVAPSVLDIPSGGGHGRATAAADPTDETTTTVASTTTGATTTLASTTTGATTTSAPTTTVAPTTTSAGSSTSATPIPTTLVPACPEDVTNHGQYVASVAHDKSASGAEHGRAVSAAARSSCGKPGVVATTVAGGGSTTVTASSTGAVPATTAASAAGPASRGNGGGNGNANGKGNGNGNGNGNAGGNGNGRGNPHG